MSRSQSSTHADACIQAIAHALAPVAMRYGGWEANQAIERAKRAFDAVRALDDEKIKSLRLDGAHEHNGALEIVIGALRA